MASSTVTALYGAPFTLGFEYDTPESIYKSTNKLAPKQAIYEFSHQLAVDRQLMAHKWPSVGDLGKFWQIQARKSSNDDGPGIKFA